MTALLLIKPKSDYGEVILYSFIGFSIGVITLDKNTKINLFSIKEPAIEECRLMLMHL